MCCTPWRDPEALTVSDKAIACGQAIRKRCSYRGAALSALDSPTGSDLPLSNAGAGTNSGRGGSASIAGPHFARALTGPAQARTPISDAISPCRRWTTPKPFATARGNGPLLDLDRFTDG